MPLREGIRAAIFRGPFTSSQAFFDFNISVTFDQEDENKYFKSIRCYEGQ
jgi:hypothetical protein